MALDTKQAEVIADDMLARARATSEARTLKADARSAKIAQLKIGFVALVGFFAGSFFGQMVFGPGFLAAAFGVICGLAAAVVFPARGPNNSINRTPLRGAGYLKR